MGFSVHKRCKHSKSALDYILAHEINLGEEELMPIEIKSSVSYMNEFFGGLPVGALLGQFAKHQTGKTVTGIQYAFDVFNYFSMTDEKSNAIIIDTEGTLGTQGLKDWVVALNKRFALSVGIEMWRLDYSTWWDSKSSQKPIRTTNIGKYWKKETLLNGDNKIILIDCPDLNKAHLIFGVPAQFDASESGKVTVKFTKEWATFNQDFNKVPIQEIVKENNIKYVLFDSFSALFESQFIGGQQNYPARHDSSVALLTQAQKVARENIIPFVVNLHPTHNPADSESEVKHLGGKSVGHNFKLLVYHRDSVKSKKTPEGATCRAVELTRHPSKINLTGKYIITNNGIEDFV
jgi:hypothetical protein